MEPFLLQVLGEKGAEVIRMMRTMAGPERFRAGCDLYFDRHDGEAATCEDFVSAIEAGAGLDLEQFRLWYSQAGAPKVTVRLDHDGQEDAEARHRTPRHDGAGRREGDRCRLHAFPRSRVFVDMAVRHCG